MSDTLELDASPEPKPEEVRPAKWLALLTVFTQALLITIVLTESLRYPGRTRSFLSAGYCLISVALGYHQVRRAFFLKRMPPRLERGDWKYNIFRALLFLSVTSVFVMAIVYVHDLIWVSRANRIGASDYFLPIILLANPWLDYLKDRLPVALPRPRRGGRKIWDTMKPIHSDAWGKRGTS